MRTTTPRGCTPMPPLIGILASRSLPRTSSRNCSTWPLTSEALSTSINRCAPPCRSRPSTIGRAGSQDGSAALQRGDGRARQEARDDEQRRGGDRAPESRRPARWRCAAFTSTALAGGTAGDVLDRLAARAHVGDAGAGEPHAHVGRDLQFDLVVVDRLGDLADQAAAGHHHVAALGRLHHLALLLGALLLRPQDQEIHDDEDDDERRELDQHVGRPHRGRAAGLREGGRDQQGDRLRKAGRKARAGAAARSIYRRASGWQCRVQACPATGGNPHAATGPAAAVFASAFASRLR